MKWPQLVKPWACCTPVILRLTSGTGEDGTPVERAMIETLCSFSEKQKQVLDAERRMVTLEGTLLFPGDIAPDLAELTGTVEIGGRRWNIFRCSWPVSRSSWMMCFWTIWKHLFRIRQWPRWKRFGEK